ncbi:myb-like DNA-binding domain-containing protein [Colletotrichum orchidophilum]|uniref:Myb-like DNA-binding domain-containing protein n=1 Tax=Colletotrichum orchidophilum TaxID=1209926 RepID=A0A1G4B0Y2_9PEZI|nr:myb-like DNA-binding domain-containing protein [Colletotrichum orchidophilum]OHE95080.1 myb-like DNA-binding domain-containing protein [Colletotrichum orchidophilum]
MFNSISRIFNRYTPTKNSSPGPARPERDDSEDRTFPSTAPPEYPDGIDDRQLARMAPENDDGLDDDFPDGLDGVNDYVDPFSSMIPFSTQADDFPDAASAAHESGEDNGVKKRKSKKNKKSSSKKARGKKGKDANKATDLEHSDAGPSSSISGGQIKNSSDAIQVDDDHLPVATQHKKKRKRASEDFTGPGASQASGRKKRKKKKTRTPVDDAEDVDMEETQPEDVVPESPESTTIAQPIVHSPASEPDPVEMKNESQQSQLLGVPRKFFTQPSGTPVLPSPDGDMTDDDKNALASSPSVAAQRRRSMSRGSQISLLRQSLVSQAAAQPYDTLQAVESTDDAVDEQVESSSESEESIEAAQQSSPIVAKPENATSDQHSINGDQDADLDETANRPSSPGPLLEDSAQSDDGSFADGLPPSSQPPRESPTSTRSEDMVAASTPQLPIKTFRDALQNSSKKQTTYSKKGSAIEKPATTPRGTRRHNAETDGEQSFGVGNLPSSAQKSNRSTASKKQRSKPDFFEKSISDHEAPEYLDVEENATNAIQEDGEDHVPHIDVAAVKKPAPTKTTKPQMKLKKAKQTAATGSLPTITDKPAKTTTPKKPAKPKGASQGPPEFVTGQFSVEETKKLTEIVEKYRDENNLTQEQMNNLIQMKQRKKTTSKAAIPYDGDKFLSMWSFICAALPDRRRQKIIDVARQSFHNFKARGGGWTSQEDAKLEMLHAKHGNCWAKIADELGRHQKDVRDRYRNYVICGSTEGRQYWTEEEERELVQHVITSLRRTDQSPSKIRKPHEPFINWQTISDLMGRKRSRLQCMRKFKTLNVELSPSEVLQSSRPASKVTWTLEKARKQIQEMPPEDKHKVVRSILAGGAGRDRKIQWTKLADLEFRRKWPKKTLQLLWYRLRQLVPNQKEKSVRDCARWLLEDAKASGPRGAKILGGGDTNYDTEDEMAVVDPPKKANRRKSKKDQPRSAELVIDSDEASDDDEDDEDSEGDEEDETRLTDLESPSAQQQPSSLAASAQSNRLMAGSMSTALSAFPSLQPAANSRLAPAESEDARPSPAKKRIRLSGGNSSRQRSMEHDGSSPEPVTAQYAVEKIPDRLKEKRENAKNRISSGNRLRSAASLQPESVQNSDVDEDMPPIRVPPSTAPTGLKAKRRPNRPTGSWARKTGGPEPPGGQLGPRYYHVLEVESDSGSSSAHDDYVRPASASPAATTPATKAHAAKRRRKDTEVAEAAA